MTTHASEPAPVACLTDEPSTQHFIFDYPSKRRKNASLSSKDQTLLLKLCARGFSRGEMAYVLGESKEVIDGKLRELLRISGHTRLSRRKSIPFHELHKAKLEAQKGRQ